jgi:hypothetical protein
MANLLVTQNHWDGFEYRSMWLMESQLDSGDTSYF